MVATSNKFNGFQKCAWRLNSAVIWNSISLSTARLCTADGNTGDDDSTVYKNDDFDKTKEGPGNRIEFDSAMDGRSGGLMTV